MTVPAERTRAVIQTREFLLDLITPKRTPGVPKAVRERARRCLRHYPGAYDMTRTVSKLPELWGAVV